MIYVLHHAAAFVLAVVAAGGLMGARWSQGHPRLAIVLWQLAVLTMVTALAGGLLAFGLAPYRQGILPGLWSFVTGPPDPVHAIAVITGVGVVFWLLAGQARSAVAVARQRRRHRDLLNLVARDGEDSLVLDHPLALAYCLPGRVPRVVVSTGAHRILTAEELRAVLAHERGHLRERHDIVLGPFTALVRMVPRCRPVARVAAEIGLLVEMCADDHAARVYGRDAVNRALEKFQVSGAGAVPPGALAAAAGSLTVRIDRLRRPRPPARRLTGVLAVALLGTVLATPLSLYLAPL